MDQEYISREAVLDDLRLAVALSPGVPHNGPVAEAVKAFIELIVAYPAADVAPVRRGRWLDTDRLTLTGACCGRQVSTRENFCPNCGAKMC